MKRLFIICLLVVMFVTVGCTQYVKVPVIETVTEIITETIVITETIEDTSKFDGLEREIEQYQELLSNLNYLLSNVYYVYQQKSDSSSTWGTGFSIEHNDKFYLITAGHVVDNEYGYFPDLGFKANFSKEWIYPRLIAYHNNWYSQDDYAIFYTDKIKSGLSVGEYAGIKNQFKLGNFHKQLNIIGTPKENLSGESGSPIISLDGGVLGILLWGVYGYTDINIVLDMIDNLG